ncbi:MAG: copper chaperone PCu(A)C [Rhodoferax sp.]
MNRFAWMPVLALAAALMAPAHAEDLVKVSDAWVRATVKGQMATGAFMTLTAHADARLVGAQSPVAGVAQVHEMKMDAGVMKMAEVQGGLPLPAGKPVALKPGGFHVMLMDLKASLVKDSTVPVTLIFEDAKGAEFKTDITLPVRATPPAGGMAMPAHDHGAHGMKSKP